MIRRARRRCPPVALLLVAFVALFVTPATLAAKRDVVQAALFKNALKAARHGDFDAFAKPLDFFKGYPLYPYLPAARLTHRLNAAPSPALDERIARFLRAHPELPPARRLKQRWLQSLVKRQRWGLLTSHAGPEPSTSVRCGLVHARIARGEAPQQAALALWDVGHSQPRSCDPVFAWMTRHDLMTPAVIQRRARRAFVAGRTGLVRYLAGKLPADSHAQHRVEHWLDLAREPSTLAQAQRVKPAIALAVFKRWALADKEAAARKLPGIVRRLGLAAESRYRMRRYIALLMAQDHRAAALDWYQRIDDARMADDEHALGWQIRAAIFQKRWRLAAQKISALPERFARHTQWRYWHARALAKLGQNARAQKLFATLALQRSFYGFLAADRRDQPYRLHTEPVTRQPSVREALRSRPAMKRAHALYRLAMRHRAAREWQLATAGLDNARLAQAATIAADWGWHSRAIMTLAQAGYWDDLAIRDPFPYKPQIQRAALNNDLPAALVLAIVRTESLFQPSVRSSAGAIGLMQLMPATAAYVANQLGINGGRARPLTAPGVNIALGARLLRHLDKRWQGNLALTVASYNAGKGKVAEWLPARRRAADVWIANIAYTETRGYVKRVLMHMMIAEARYGDVGTSLTAKLRPIQPSYSELASAR